MALLVVLVELEASRLTTGELGFDKSTALVITLEVGGPRLPVAESKGQN